GDLLDLVLVQGRPDADVVLAEGQQHHGGLLRPAQAGDVDDRLGLAPAHAVSCSQLRRIETDSSGWFSTNSETRLTDEAFTCPSMRAMSMRCSMSGLGRARGSPPWSAESCAVPPSAVETRCVVWGPPAAAS